MKVVVSMEFWGNTHRCLCYPYGPTPVQGKLDTRNEYYDLLSSRWHEMRGFKSEIHDKRKSLNFPLSAVSHLFVKSEAMNLFCDPHIFHFCYSCFSLPFFHFRFIVCEQNRSLKSSFACCSLCHARSSHYTLHLTHEKFLERSFGRNQSKDIFIL